ncbi:MAG: cytochrome c biogenesis protein CcsA [Bdellovibrionota bacterium]
MLVHILSLVAIACYGFSTFRYYRTYYPRGPVANPVRPATLRSVLLVGLLAHAAFLMLTASGVAADGRLPRFPYVISLVSVILVGLFLAVERRLKISALGTFVAPLALLFFLLSAVFFHATAGAAPHAQSGVLLSIHFLCTLSAYVFFLVSFCASMAFLTGETLLKRKRPILTESPLPSLVFLDRCNRSAIALGFALLTLGILFGVIYTEVFEIDREMLQSRLLWALPMIGVYGWLGCAILIRGMRGRRLTYGALVGFGALLISFFGTGIHSGSFHV